MGVRDTTDGECIGTGTQRNRRSDSKRVVEPWMTRWVRWNSRPRRTAACLLVGERKQLDQPRTWWDMWNVPSQQPQSPLSFLSVVLLQDVVRPLRCAPFLTSLSLSSPHPIPLPSMVRYLIRESGHCGAPPLQLLACGLLTTFSFFASILVCRVPF